MLSRFLFSIQNINVLYCPWMSLFLGTCNCFYDWSYSLLLLLLLLLISDQQGLPMECPKRNFYHTPPVGGCVHRVDLGCILTTVIHFEPLCTGPFNSECSAWILKLKKIKKEKQCNIIYFCIICKEPIFVETCFVPLNRHKSTSVKLMIYMMIWFDDLKRFYLFIYI